ncbi:MAG: hypothetical protein ACF8SC_08425 [Phycisphaerales bacterium JB037]
MPEAGPHNARAHAAAQSAQRVVIQMREAPLWLRALLLLLILVGFLIGLLIIVPLAILAIIVAVIARGVRSLRRAFVGPNGPLDKRRNVRVIVPDRHD